MIRRIGKPAMISFPQPDEKSRAVRHENVAALFCA